MVKQPTDRGEVRKRSCKVIISVCSFILIITIAFVILKFAVPKGKSDKATDSDTVETKYIYETNTNLEINALITDYYAAISTCDQATLKQLTIDSSKFDNMSVYQKRAQVVYNYININCYTVDGFTEDSTIVYVVSNMVLSGIESKPLDIERFYIRENENEYIIDNTEHDTDTQEYINRINEYEDIQGLYYTVMANTEECIQDDQAFADFYRQITSD